MQAYVCAHGVCMGVCLLEMNWEERSEENET